MKKLLIAFILFIFSSSFVTLKGQTWCWGVSGDASIKSDDYGSPVTTNKYGNVFITGQFENQIIFGKDTLRDSYDNTYVTKYNADGVVLWARNPKSLGSTSSYGQGIVSDSLDNVYFTGFFNGTLIFGSDTLNTSGIEGFIVKYSPSGSLMWAKQFSSYGEAIALDREGNIWVGASGYLYKYTTSGIQLLSQPCSYPANNGNGMIMDNRINSYTTNILDTSYGSQITEIPFLAKYDSSGSLQWVRKPAIASIMSGGYGLSVVTDKAGYVYETGFVLDTIVFGRDSLIAGFKNDGSDSAKHNLFLAKYSPSGNLVWAKQNIGRQNFRGTSLSRDRSDHIYLGGSGLKVDSLSFGGGLLILPSPKDAGFIMELDTAGNYIKGSFLINGTFTREPNQYLNQTATDSTGNYVYLTGSFEGDTVIVSNDTLIDKWGGLAAYLARWNMGQCVGPASIDEHKKDNAAVTLYPNPNYGVFNIRAEKQSGETGVEVYDMLGRKVYSQSFNIQNSAFNINLSSSPAGVYLYRVISESGTLIGSGKFVIE